MSAKKTNTKTRKEPQVYYLCWTTGIEGSTAKGPKNGKLFCHYLPKNQHIDTWTPIRFELPKPIFEDYQGNDMGFHLFSERFRDLIDQHKQLKDSFQWLENPVFYRDEERLYFILHFYDIDDVLDENRIFWQSDGSIIKPAFTASKVQGHSIFTYMDKVCSFANRRAYVTKELKHAILEAKMTGVTFEGRNITNDLADG